MTLVQGLIRTARPKQWIKNVLVVAAPAAAGVLGHRGVLFDTFIAFASFCIAASGTYFLNDAFDVDADRRHAKKRSRPIAAASGLCRPSSSRTASCSSPVSAWRSFPVGASPS